MAAAVAGERGSGICQVGCGRSRKVELTGSFFCLICWSRVVRTGDSREERWPWKKMLRLPVECAVPQGTFQGKMASACWMDGSWLRVIWAKDATLGSLVGAQYGGQRAGMDFTPGTPWPDVVFLEPTCTSMGEAKFAFHPRQRTDIRVPSRDKPPGEESPEEPS